MMTFVKLKLSDLRTTTITHDVDTESRSTLPYAGRFVSHYKSARQYFFIFDILN